MALAKRARRRRLLAPDAETAFAVQHFAFIEITLGGGDNIGVKSGGRAGRLATQRRRRDRDAQFQSDHVGRTVERRITAAPVRHQMIFAKAAARVVVAFEHHISAERQMVRHVAPIAVNRR